MTKAPGQGALGLHCKLDFFAINAVLALSKSKSLPMLNAGPEMTWLIHRLERDYGSKDPVYQWALQCQRQ
jgi:hypothetical protein